MKPQSVIHSTVETSLLHENLVARRSQDETLIFSEGGGRPDDVCRFENPVEHGGSDSCAGWTP